MNLQQGTELIKTLSENINKTLIGQSEIVEMALTCLLAGGHLLIEGVPGLGKTLLVRSIAKSFAGEFSRIQFTPDLMPSDVTGHAMFDPKSEKFRIRKGPAFTNLLLADEINRAPAKTQSALLEVMQEKKITIEGKSQPVSSPFMVLATQNPLEQEGTYPLPEAELDRFLMNVLIDYPAIEDEVALVKTITTGEIDDSILMRELTAVTDPDSIIALQNLASSIMVDDALFDYAVRIVAATREWSGVQMGASPRASIALIRAARALALVRGSEFVTPDEIKAVALPVMRHRIVLSAELEIEGIGVSQVIADILAQVAAPRD
ncbi:MoxR family ATPase [Aliikangiella marina]|uniref:MoxR family ATPase n=2 Tax=Aliikangiella marina TaxID=1712262 RepID=A0A545T5F3_9GAMM|nr:MoxR family ATPase [Aliikangiella marina]TQV72433.1 MoxR family ATPase [Aliikangiella marina]